MSRKFILFIVLCLVVVGFSECANRGYQYKPTASYRPWRYYNNYKPFSSWHKPGRGGHGGYYNRPRHRYHTKLYHNRGKGWYQTNGYSR